MDLPLDVSISMDPEPDDTVRALFDLIARMSENANDANGRQVSTGLLFSLFGLCVLPTVIGPLCSQAYYLPADRTGAMHLYKLVARTLIADAASASPASSSPR